MNAKAELRPDENPLWGEARDRYADEDHYSNEDVTDSVLGAETLDGGELGDPTERAAELLAEWQEAEGPTDWAKLRADRVKELDEWAAELSNNVVDFPKRARQGDGEGAWKDDEGRDRYNDAVVTGEATPEWLALLERPMTFLLPGDPHRDAQQKRWKNHTDPLAVWLRGGPGGTLTRHVEAKRKGYMPMVFGASAGKKRSANAMVSVECMALDIDSGSSRAEAEERAKELGLACLSYTSFNNGTERSLIGRDAVIKHFKIEEDPTDEQVRQYLTDRGGHTVAHIASVRIANQHVPTDEGVKIELAHDALEKFRLVFPLAETLTISSLGPTQRKQQDHFKAKLRGLAAKIGVVMDEACVDVCRAFYLPSHPPGGEWAITVFQGRGLKLDELDEVPPKNARHDSDPRTPDGESLKRWAVNHATRLELGRLIDAEASDRVRDTKGDILVVECPFDEWHGNAGDSDDTACHVRDADPVAEQGFVWKCKHNACSGHDRLDMIAKALEDGWFPETALTDEAYLLPDEEEEAEAPPRNDDAGSTGGDCAGSLSDPERFEDPKDWLPKKGYKIAHGAIWKKGKDSDTRLCQTFNVVGRASNVAGDAGAGRIIHFVNENGVEVEMTLHMADLIRDSGGGVLEVLANAGMRLFVGDKPTRDAFLNLLRQITPQRHIPTVARPGWVRDRGGVIVGFLCPTGEFIPAKARDLGQPFRLAPSATVKDRAPKGTFAGWKDAADAAFANITVKKDGTPTAELPPNFYWIIGLAAAFAGPLLSLAGMEARGFNLSGESSRGKTMALLLGSTAWATPADKKGVLFTMNATNNSLENLATIGSESFLGMDELGAMQRPQDLGAILFGLSTGSGKSRMAGVGVGSGLAEDAEFLTFAMMTNERGLRDVIMGAGGDYKTGISARFPDLSVTEGARVSAETIKRLEAVKANFGHAGPRFVKWLIAQRWHEKGHDLRQRIDKTAAELAGDVNPAQARAAKVFGLVQVAGELACEAGILPDADKLRAAVLTAWETFKESAEGKATEGEVSLLDGFRSWIIQSMGVHIAEIGGETSRELMGWETSDQFVFLKSALSMKAMGLNGTLTGLMKALDECGALIKSGRNSYHNKLPAEVPRNGKAANARLDRAKLGLPRILPPPARREVKIDPAKRGVLAPGAITEA